MGIRYFAVIAGAVYVLVGLLGFLPALKTPPAGTPDLVVDAGYGLLMGLFPVNVLHNFVHIALGIWGIAAFVSVGAARFYARSLAVIYGVLAVMGLVPGLNTMLGLVPIFGHDIWLHALTALVAAYFGWIAASSPHPVTAPGTRQTS